MKTFLIGLLPLTLAAQGAGGVLFENDQVRVLKVTVQPGQKSPQHKHDLNRVMIYLGEGGQKLTYQDGKVDDQRWKAGEVRWSPAGGLHTSESSSNRSFQIVEVELKNKPFRGRAAVSALDPVRVSPKNYAVEMDNDQVRVIRFRNSALGKIPMHEHSLDRITVFLTDFHARVIPADGATSELHKQAGDVTWGGPAKHAEDNLSNHAVEVVAVEIKK